jgi:hypothetical protein
MDDDEGDDNPCTEDEEFFQGRPDADDMEEAITKFFYGMEGQERSGFRRGRSEVASRTCTVAAFPCPLQRDIIECLILKL